VRAEFGPRMIGGRQLTLPACTNRLRRSQAGISAGIDRAANQDEFIPHTGMPPMLALATKRAAAEEADNAEAVALLCTFSEETDCAGHIRVGRRRSDRGRVVR